MKKANYFFGILSVVLILLSIFCKMFHFPGANIFIVAGAVMFVIPYYLFVQLQKIKTANDKIERIACVFKFITIALLVCTSLLYFFALHCFYYTFILAFLSLIIFLFFNYKVLAKSGNNEKAFNKALIFIGLIVLFFVVISKPLDNKLFKTLTFIDNHTNMITALTDTAIKKDFISFEKLNAQFPGFTSTYFIKAEKVRNVSDSVVKIISDLRKELIISTEKIDKSKIDSIPLYSLKSRYNKIAASKYFIQDKEDLKLGKAAVIKKTMKFYEKQLNSIIDDKDNILKVAFIEGPFVDKKEGSTQPWEISMFYHTPLINDILYIDNIIASVRQSEYQAINNLQGKGKSEIIWYYWKKYQESKPQK
jgi:hypothetical protein